MTEEILPDLLRIKIPLPDTPLKYFNSYVIKAEPRSLIVDTGLNHDICFEAMQAGLAETGLDIRRGAGIYWKAMEETLMFSSLTVNRMFSSMSTGTDRPVPSKILVTLEPLNQSAENGP